MLLKAKIIRGGEVAGLLYDKLKKDIVEINQKHGVIPCLVVILVGNNAASGIYVRNKRRKAQEIGIETRLIELDESVLEVELLERIHGLNTDNDVHGILVQLPLPSHINDNNVIFHINPKKDVDGFHVDNIGKMVIGSYDTCLMPCTALGCIDLIKSQLDDLIGKKVTVVGCSNIVGKPLVQLLLSELCTVTVGHKYSVIEDLKLSCRKSDVIVVAAGSPNLITKDWVKPGAIVIDVGINRVDSDNDKGYKIVGDVDFEEVSQIASAITPVPGGVGLMTVAHLMNNTVLATKRLICDSSS